MSKPSPITEEQKREIEIKSNELFSLLTQQLDEWKDYLKSFLYDHEHIKVYVDRIIVNVASVKKPSDLAQNAFISVLYEMPDELVNFARSGNAPEEFTKALLEDGVELDEASIVTPTN